VEVGDGEVVVRSGLVKYECLDYEASGFKSFHSRLPHPSFFLPFKSRGQRKVAGFSLKLIDLMHWCISY